jgi:hypothetical protein
MAPGLTHLPVLGSLLGRWVLNLRPIDNEVSQGLGLYGRLRNELDGEHAEIDRPFDDSAVGVSVVEDVAGWKQGYDLDTVCLEVISELPGCDEDRVEELLDLLIVHLGVTKYFTNEVERSLNLLDVSWLISLDDKDSANHMGGSHDVEEQVSPSSGAVSTGGLVKNSFRWRNALDASSFHTNLSIFQRSLKKGMP